MLVLCLASVKTTQGGVGFDGLCEGEVKALPSNTLSTMLSTLAACPLAA